MHGAPWSMVHDRVKLDHDRDQSIRWRERILMRLIMHETEFNHTSAFFSQIRIQL